MPDLPRGRCTPRFSGAAGALSKLFVCVPARAEIVGGRRWSAADAGVEGRKGDAERSQGTRSGYSAQGGCCGFCWSERARERARSPQGQGRQGERAASKSSEASLGREGGGDSKSYQAH